jgi:hydroxyacylglutathione hydrolase
VTLVFEPILDPTLGCASYILGDDSVGSAAVVDPLEAVGVDTYIVRAAEAGLTIEHVIESHVHADHASAGPALAAALGLPVSLHAGARPTYASRPLADGDEIRLGGLSLTVWYTPGHTPDSISLVVTDRARADEPWFVLTGDALFVGDVGRPDLVDGAGEAAVRDAARDLYRSLHERLLTLPDHVEVYPAHYGASACGGLFMSRKPWSTIGFERRANRALQAPDADRFASHVLALVKPPPPEAGALRRRNLGVATVPGDATGGGWA